MSGNDNWTIGYNVTAGSLRELIVSVRDSAARGDLCVETQLRNAVSGQITLTPNARDCANACGITYAEWVDGTLIEVADNTVESSLALLIWARGTNTSTSPSPSAIRLLPDRETEGGGGPGTRPLSAVLE